MATAVDTEIQDHVDAGPSIYLGLPPEVRNMIYRLLLVTFIDTVLGPFGILRNIRSVAIHGVPLLYAERLRRLMLGNTPHPNVEGMYCSLENIVRDLNGDPSDLDKARKPCRSGMSKSSGEQ